MVLFFLFSISFAFDKEYQCIFHSDSRFDVVYKSVEKEKANGRGKGREREKKHTKIDFNIE